MSSNHKSGYAAFAVALLAGSAFLGMPACAATSTTSTTSTTTSTTGPASGAYRPLPVTGLTQYSGFSGSGFVVFTNQPNGNVTYTTSSGSGTLTIGSSPQ
jgi:hypothetical protein